MSSGADPSVIKASIYPEDLPDWTVIRSDMRELNTETRIALREKKRGDEFSIIANLTMELLRFDVFFSRPDVMPRVREFYATYLRLYTLGLECNTRSGHVDEETGLWVVDFCPCEICSIERRFRALNDEMRPYQGIRQLNFGRLRTRTTSQEKWEGYVVEHDNTATNPTVPTVLGGSDDSIERIARHMAEYQYNLYRASVMEGLPLNFCEGGIKHQFWSKWVNFLLEWSDPEYADEMFESRTNEGWFDTGEGGGFTVLLESLAFGGAFTEDYYSSLLTMAFQPLRVVVPNPKPPKDDAKKAAPRRFAFSYDHPLWNRVVRDNLNPFSKELDFLTTYRNKMGVYPLEGVVTEIYRGGYTHRPIIIEPKNEDLTVNRANPVWVENLPSVIFKNKTLGYVQYAECKGNKAYNRYEQVLFIGSNKTYMQVRVGDLIDKETEEATNVRDEAKYGFRYFDIEIYFNAFVPSVQRFNPMTTHIECNENRIIEVIPIGSGFGQTLNYSSGMA